MGSQSDSRSSALLTISVTGHLSRASGKIVWFVNAKTSDTICHDPVQPSPSWSIKMRISSGMAITGCVSLSCIEMCWGNSENSRPDSLYRRTISCRDADTKKCCCFKRSSFPCNQHHHHSPPPPKKKRIIEQRIRTGDIISFKIWVLIYLIGSIVWIEDWGDCLSPLFIQNCCDIVASVERFQVKFWTGLGTP